MALPIFPSLPGLAWPFTRTSVGGSNLIFQAASGVTTAAQLWQNPLYEWELSYDGLATGFAFPGLGANSKQLLESFFLQVGGRASPFLFNDVSDNYQAGAALGVGDGSTTTFAARRTLGSFAEPIDVIANVAAVYLNGAAQPGAAWDVTAPNGTDPNAVTFATAPAAGAVVTADFWFLFKARFSTDSLDFRQIMKDIWQVDGVKFRRERV